MKLLLLLLLMLFLVDNDDEVENPCLGALLLLGDVKELLATDADLSTCCKRIYILPINRFVSHDDFV